MKRHILYLLIALILGYLGWLAYEFDSSLASNGLPKYPKWTWYLWIPLGIISGMLLRKGLVGLFGDSKNHRNSR